MKCAKLNVRRTRAVLGNNLFNDLRFDAVNNKIARPRHQMSIGKDAYVRLPDRQLVFSRVLVSRYVTLCWNSSTKAWYLAGRSHAFTLQTFQVP